MIQPETIALARDTTKVVSDSIVKSDSLAMLDSLRVVDSIKAIAKIPTGFIGTPHPSVPNTESWVFLVLLALFFLLIYSLGRSFALISDTVNNFFQVKERSSIFSKATVNDSSLRFLLSIFAIGVLSFFACLLQHNSSVTISIKEFGLFLLATSVFFCIKYLILDLIGYVFLNRINFKMAKVAYFNVVSLLGVMLFPFLFFHIYAGEYISGIADIISLILCVCAAILIIIKLFQIFFQKILASFYILLYLCTLEFLPLIILFKVYKLISFGV
jgi:hypothetical protein